MDQTRVADLADEIERAGGTRTAFLGVMDPGAPHDNTRASYTLGRRAGGENASGEQ